jgi:DegV family protein with EDD domain
MLAAQQVDPGRVTVYDSGSVSMGLGWQLAAAAEVAERGAPPQEIIQVAESVRSRIKVLAMIDTLEFLRKGGRVSYVVAGLGTLLQIKPIIDVAEGVVNTAQRQRTTGRALQALVDMTLGFGRLDRLAVLHSANEKGAEDLRGRLAAVAPQDSILIEVTPAIGVHTGPGCLGVALVKGKA